MSKANDKYVLTINKVLAYAKKNNLDYVVEYAQSYVLRYESRTDIVSLHNHGTDYKARIGIELKPHVYYWFSCYTHDCTSIDSEYLLFEQRYNRNSGVIQRSFFRGQQAKRKILGTEY